jgi:hypothetical protein
VERVPRPQSLDTWCAAIAFGGLIYFLLPSQVIVINDDFGYLRSVLQTIQHGRPWTGDWLAPWSASLAVSSALIFKATGSFHTATYGLQAVFAGAAFGGAHALLRERGLSDAASLTVAALFLSIPTFFYKMLEYTGVTLYLPCLLWALWAAEKRRWGWFFIPWFLGVASRQSAMTWLVFPALACVRSFFENRDAHRAWQKPAIVLFGAAAAFALLSLGMNKTQSQAMTTPHLLERLNPERSTQSALFGMVAFLAFAGLGALALGLSDKSRSPFAGFRPLRAFGVLAGVALLLVLLKNHPLPLIFEHNCYRDTVGGRYLLLLPVTALMGWLVCRFSLRWDAVFAGVGSLALVCLSIDLYDYYFLDVFVFGFFAPVLVPEPASDRISPRWRKIAALCTVLLFGSLHLYVVLQLKFFLDCAYALCILGETALRERRLDAADLSFAPFGFIGWHLHPHFVLYDGKTDPDIGGFMQYLRRNAVEAQFSPLSFRRDSPALRTAPPENGQSLIASGVFSVYWFWNERCSLLQNPPQMVGPAALPLDGTKYHLSFFPLDEREWLLKSQVSAP